MNFWEPLLLAASDSVSDLGKEAHPSRNSILHLFHMRIPGCKAGVGKRSGPQGGSLAGWEALWGSGDPSHPSVCIQLLL